MADNNDTLIQSSQASTTNWKLCFICQKPAGKNETLACSANRTNIKSYYTTFANLIKELSDLGVHLPKSFMSRLNEHDQGIEQTLVVNKALHHNRCRLKYMNLKRRHEDLQKEKNDNIDDASKERSSKRQRLSVDALTTPTCFICNKELDSSDTKYQRQAMTLQ